MENNEGILVEGVPNCPRCGASGGILYADLRDRFFGVPGRWSLRRCPRCTYVWLDPTPLAGELPKVYATYRRMHMEKQMLEPPTDPLAAAARRGLLHAMGYRGVIQRRREGWLGRVIYLVPKYRETIENETMSLRGPAMGRLLDIGCGTGFFLFSMAALGWDPTGLEIDEVPAAIARAKYGLRVMTQSIEQAQLSPQDFDAITMNHVIEHVREPALVMRKCYLALRVGGRISLRTPNLESQGHARFGPSWMHLDPPRHLQIFSPGTLRTLVEEAGFRNLRVRTSHIDAPSTYDVSKGIHRAGVYDLEGPRKAGPRAHFFRLSEAVVNSVTHTAGEEIVLVAHREV